MVPAGAFATTRTGCGADPGVLLSWRSGEAALIVIVLLLHVASMHLHAL